MVDLETLLGAGVLSTVTLRRAKTFDGQGRPNVEWTAQLHVYDERPSSQDAKATARAGLVTGGRHVHVTGTSLDEILSKLEEKHAAEEDR